MKRVAVVILNWNGKKLMEKFLPSVLANTTDALAEVVVADNGSTDESVDMLKTDFPQVTRICLEKNYGFAGGYNRAIGQLDHEYVVLLNSDVEVTRGWLEPLVKILDHTLDIVAVQPKILSQRNPSFFEYAGAAGGFIDKYGYPFCRGRLFSTLEKDEGQYNVACNIFWASGAALMIRNAVYKDSGGLDDNFFAHQEEIDLCWRLHHKGFAIVCEPRSVVYHVGGASLEMESPYKTYLNFRNNLLMLYKNLPEEKLLSVFFVRFWLDYLAAFQFLLKGHFANARSVYKARKEFGQMKKEYQNIRLQIHADSKATSYSGIYPKSILAAYYLEGKKTFQKLSFITSP